MRYSLRHMGKGLAMFFVGTAELLLFLRVVLRFFNGNPDAQFVHWCYASTNTLLEPFRGIFTSAGTVSRGWVVDYVALFAMAAYALVALWAVNLAVWPMMKKK